MRLEKFWHSALQKEIQKPYMKALSCFLEEEKRRGATVYPQEELIFEAFRLTPPDKVRVVIMGQDPYHGEGQAHGLSFSVPQGVPFPPSLKNIFKELVQDIGVDYPQQGCLSSWANQGVLLLNTTLTVRAKEPLSHHGKGWETFTDSVIATLLQKKDPVVFVLWGKSAEKKFSQIQQAKNKNHAVLIAGHPSPLSVRRFQGCRHFSKINAYLHQFNMQEIDWRLS